MSTRIGDSSFRALPSHWPSYTVSETAYRGERTATYEDKHFLEIYYESDEKNERCLYEITEVRSIF